jgi:hypothetical protein
MFHNDHDQGYVGVPIKPSEKMCNGWSWTAPGSCIQMGVSFLWDIPLVLPSMINGTMINIHWIWDDKLMEFCLSWGQ